jgi:Predicted outer membrane protein
MRTAWYIVAGWCMILTSFTIVSCQTDQSNERIAKERNSEQLDADEKKDAQLVVDLSTGQYAAIEMAKRARERSQNKEVRDLAGMLETAHTTLINQLKEYAVNKNISIPGAALEEMKKRSDNLAENNRPASFDKKWCAEMLDMHERAISQLEMAANDALDPDLRTWVNTTLPKIRTHRERIKECYDSIK